MAKHVAGGIRYLESLGYRPFMRGGALLSTLRHRGWMDFGGTKDQSGYDMDPTVMMTADELDELADNPIISGDYYYTWEKGLTLKGYVYRHCPSPRKTVNFYKNVLEIDVEQHKGGTLRYKGIIVADVAGLFRWKFANSFIHPMCGQRPFNPTPSQDSALLLRGDDIYPVTRASFYDYALPVPAKAHRVLKKMRGSKAMTIVRFKVSDGRGLTSESYSLLSGYAPAVPLGPCEPNSRFEHMSWYPEYARRVRMVRPLPHCESCVRSVESRKANPWHHFSMETACSRWWHATPQNFYHDLPWRKWSGTLRPKNHVPPPCSFGQATLPKTRCFESQQYLFAALDRLRVVYFARSGTALGIVRGSRYLSHDGDVDVYVDMPQPMLFEKLKLSMRPHPRLMGTGLTAEVHWNVVGCPEVYMQYNEWTSDELQHRAGPEDVCTCRMNSVEMLCHKDAAQHMYTQYGPSFSVPVAAKQLEIPHWMVLNPTHPWSINTRNVLQELVNESTGVISTLSGETTDPLALAHLNVALASVEDGPIVDGPM